MIPHLFDGRNKVFFFGDYEGFKRRLRCHLGGVPTAQERSGSYTNFRNYCRRELGLTPWVGCRSGRFWIRPLLAMQDPVSFVIPSTTLRHGG